MIFKYIIFKDDSYVIINRKAEYNKFIPKNKKISSAGNGVLHYDFDYDRLRVVCVSGTTTLKNIAHSLVQSGKDSAFLNKNII